MRKDEGRGWKSGEHTCVRDIKRAGGINRRKLNKTRGKDEAGGGFKEEAVTVSFKGYNYVKINTAKGSP